MNTEDIPTTQPSAYFFDFPEPIPDFRLSSKIRSGHRVRHAENGSKGRVSTMDGDTAYVIWDEGYHETLRPISLSVRKLRPSEL